jgi:hypothetical protein
MKSTACLTFYVRAGDSSAYVSGHGIDEMDIPLYRIKYILKVSIDHFKHTQIDSEERRISSSTLNDDISLSFEGRNKKFVNQLVYESIAQFTTGREQKDREIIEDIPYDLLARDGRGRLYGTPS